MQRDSTDVSRACLHRSLEQRLELMRSVVDAWHQGSNQDAGWDTRTIELRDCLQAGARIRGMRLGGSPSTLVECGDREACPDRGPLRYLQHQRQVAQQKRRLGEYRARIGGVAQSFPDAHHQAIATL